MRISTEKRIRLIIFYLKNDLNFVKNWFEILRELVEKEDIIISKRSISNILNRWFETGCLNDKPSESRGINHTLITYEQLSILDRLVSRKQGLSAIKLKKKLK